MKLVYAGRTFVISPEPVGWKLCEIRVKGEEAKPENRGQVYEADVSWPGTYPQALRMLLDRAVQAKLGDEPETTLEQATATVAYLYETIGQKAAEEIQRLHLEAT